jgi:superoxide reductase
MMSDIGSSTGTGSVPGRNGTAALFPQGGQMPKRRDFLRGSLALTGAAVVLGSSALRAAAFPAGIVFTKSAPGRWAGREGSHAPQISVENGKVKIVTPHAMTEQHFIVKHVLLKPDGEVLGEKTFSPADGKAESEYSLPTGFKGTVYATSFCNLHDLWLTETTV